MLLYHVDVRNAAFMCSSNIAHLRQQCYNSKFVIFQENILKVLECYNFLWVQIRHNCSPAASFANCVMILYLLKVYLQTFISTPITQKCQILSCDNLVANERYKGSKNYSNFKLQLLRAPFLQKEKGQAVWHVYVLPRTSPFVTSTSAPNSPQESLPSAVAIHIANVMLSYNCFVLVVLGIMKICQASE